MPYCMDYGCPMSGQPGIRSPGLDPAGSANPLIYLVSSAPGFQEDQLGAPFTGESGVQTIAAFKQRIPAEHIRVNYVVRCAPYNEKSQRVEKPSKKAIFACSKSLLADIEATKPKIVIAVGDVAKAALFHSTVALSLMRGSPRELMAGAYKVPAMAIFDHAYLRRRNMPRDEVLQWVGDITRAVNIATGAEQVQAHKKDFRILSSLGEIKEYMDFLQDGVDTGTFPYIVTDIESSGLSPFVPENELLLLGITHAPHQSVIVPIDHFESPLRGQRKEIGDLLRPLGAMPLANQNMKFDYQWYRHELDIVMTQIVFDTYFAHHAMFQTTRANDIESIGAMYMNEPAWEYRVKESVERIRTKIKAAVSAWKKQYKAEYKKGFVNPETQQALDLWTGWQVASKMGKGYSVVPIGDLAHYCCIDCDVTYRAVPVLQKMLQEANLLDMYQRMFMTNIVPWCDIQYEGISIDPNAVQAHNDTFPQKLENIKHEFNKLTLVQATAELIGKPDVNMNSPKQVSTLLYDVMKCAAPKDKKKGARTTDNEHLKVLKGAADRKDTKQSREAASVLSSIMDFRTTSKIFSSYVTGMAKFAVDDLIHPVWNIAGTDTGRASAKEPPIHSQPKELRDIIVSRYADIGGAILYMDQSQVEVRGFASIANDPFLIDTYNTPGADVHRMLASMLFSKPPEQITDAERQIAKTCVFASLYGGGPARIAGQTGMPLDEAKVVHARFTSIITLNQFKDRLWSELTQFGYVTTPFGRIRIIPIPDSEQKQYHAKNQSINTPIQSAASDITLESITRLWYRMLYAGMKSKIIIWHHDAIVWDVFPGELPTLLDMAQEAMVTEPMQMYDWLRVPLKIEGGFGANWRDDLEVVERNGTQVHVDGKRKNYETLMATPFAQLNPSVVTEEYEKHGTPMVKAVFNLAS